MNRYILTNVSLALIAVVGVSLAENLSNKQLTADQSPFKSDLAFKFFDVASQISPEFKNLTISTHHDTENNDTQCYKDIEAIKNGLQNYEEWAIEYPDSWGRIPFGILWYHFISMGQFEECIAATRKISEDHTIKGQYCLAKIPITINNTTQQNLQLGTCVPKSCSPSTINKILKTVIKTYFAQDIKTNMISEDLCKFDEPIQLRGIDIFAIVLLCFIVFCMIASSIYDYIQTQNQQAKNPLFLAFSVLTNARSIFTVKKVDNPNVIKCLNGIRCLSMMWVVFGHEYLIFSRLSLINIKTMLNWLETPYSMLIVNATLSVDTFFFMSGLLIIWCAFREMEKTKGYLNIKLMYFHRYIRLTPVLAVVILYVMSLHKYSGDGPMRMRSGKMESNCEDTWWATLLYVQNYVYPTKMCIGPTWYLAVDTQLYILSPLFLIPLWKWGKKALAPIVVLMILCLGCTFATFMYHHFTLFMFTDSQVSLRMSRTYFPTHTRMPTWLIGIIFGYFLFTKNRGRKIPLKKHWVIIGWLLAFGVMLTDLWGPYWRVLPASPDAPILEGAFYEPLSRVSWTLAMGWIVWACYNGHGGVINDFLSWEFFTVFGRLTYSIYIMHMVVQTINASKTQTDLHFSNYNAILRFWQDFGITLTASIFTTLAFEAPILGIEKALLGLGNNKKKKVESTKTNAQVIPAENSTKF